MTDGFHLEKSIKALLTCAVLMTVVCRGWAVTSKITRQASSADLLKGQTKDVIIGSRGTIELGRAADVLVAQFEDAWSINSIIVSGGTVYMGTSPNGSIYKYSLGKLTKIYPPEGDSSLEEDRKEKTESTERLGSEQGVESHDVNEPCDANTVEAEQYPSNEHIFAMAIDVAGRLLVGISGDKCKLCRLEAGKLETVYEPNDAKYILAIATDDVGNIYLGTGPEGKIYRTDAFGRKAQLIYDSRDKNMLSMAIGQDGFVYAGSDSRGLVYKIDPRTKTATVLYDSDQPEITALLLTEPSSENGSLYAVATSAEIVKTEIRLASELSTAGRPDIPSPESKSVSESGRRLQIANTTEKTVGKSTVRKALPPKGAKPGAASHIYKVTKGGYVTDIFSEAAVFLCLVEQDGKLVLGTGNNAQLFSVDPASEDKAIIYEDEQASQITAVAVSGDDVYVGTANPAKLIRLGRTFASEGTYNSDLIDAGQPAKWGKLQIEADVPQGCKVLVASRSGNVKDVNDPTFSGWTELTEVTEPIQLRCPLGRFCQYRLVLRSEGGHETPTIREVAVASTVPNLPPRVESVMVGRIAVTGKTGMFKIGYKAKDDNGDKLIYKIDFRKAGRTSWIELEDEQEADSFDWDGRTVEDGRYEIRVIASDERSNTSTTKLTGSRVSEPVVVDNTGPVIGEHSVETNEKTITLKVQISDEFSAIGELHYTVDSNADWIAAMPDDLVYDTTDENFTIVIEDLEAGEHILALRIRDDVGNTTYKTFELSVSDE